MIYLILAVVSSAGISIVMRASEKYVKNEMGMFMANYFVCMALSLGFMEDKTQLLALTGVRTNMTLVLGIVSGVLFLGNFLFYKYNMKQNGIVMSATFMKLGVLVPTIMAVVVFGESPKWIQVVGVIIAVGAIVLLNFEKSAVAENKKMFWLIALLLWSGFTDSMANIFDQLADPTQKDAYLLQTFLTAFIITLTLIILMRARVCVYDLVFGALIGIPNYFSSLFLILSLQKLEAVIVYPTYSVATMITVAVAGVIFFHENLSRTKLCALGMILLALVCLNV